MLLRFQALGFGGFLAEVLEAADLVAEGAQGIVIGIAQVVIIGHTSIISHYDISGVRPRYTCSTTFNNPLSEVSVEYILPLGSRQWVSRVNGS